MLGAMIFRFPSFDASSLAAAARHTDGVMPLANPQGGRTDKEEQIMPPTRNFRETVQARARRDVKFSAGLAR
jgi:hypothetical protein